MNIYTDVDREKIEALRVLIAGGAPPTGPLWTVDSCSQCHRDLIDGGCDYCNMENLDDGHGHSPLPDDQSPRPVKRYSACPAWLKDMPRMKDEKAARGMNNEKAALAHIKKDEKAALAQHKKMVDKIQASKTSIIKEDKALARRLKDEKDFEKLLLSQDEPEEKPAEPLVKQKPQRRYRKFSSDVVPPRTPQL